MPDNKPKISSTSPLRRLIKIFRTGNAIKHHFQGGQNQGTPMGTAKAYFKNAYSFQSSVIPGYSSYDRFSRYSDYCEQESFAILANALNIFADEVTQRNEKGKIIDVSSENEAIQSTLQDLMDNVLKLNGKNCWKMVRYLLKYGDSFYLIDATETNGIINLIYMPANEVEREEGFDKEEPGAIRFRWTTKQNIEIPNSYVAHFRLDGNDMFKPYGMSVLEPARRAWRQLCVIINDSVWMADGSYKKIQDVKPNDIIYCHDYDKNETRKTKVVAVSPMGKQKLVKVKTRHREICVTPNHGLLIKNKKGQFEYKKAEDLICSAGKSGYSTVKCDKLVLPYVKDGVRDFSVELSPANYFVKLNSRLEYDPIGVMSKIESLGCSDSGKNIHSFLNGKKKISYQDYIKVKERFGIQDKDLEGFYFKGSPQKTFTNNFTFKVTKEFVRLFGMMLGDGWANKKRGRIGFALGEYPEQDRYYISLLEGLLDKKATITEAEEKRGGQANVNSVEFVELFEQLGFKTGVFNKRIPDWVYKLHPEYKIELLKGYFDADGSDNDGRISSANKKLLEDARILAQQCGLEVGREVLVDREEGYYYDKSFGKEIYRQTSYRLWLNLNKVHKETQYEYVLSVEEIEENETFDLQVEDEVHNFVCEGIVSHNTLLEDAMLVYRITRAPERRVFMLDLSGLPAEDRDAAIEKFNQQLKKNRIVNDEGKIDLRYASTMSMEEDYIIPIIGHDSKTRIETLPGAQNIGDIEDIQYIEQKLFAAIGIPKAYLTYEGDVAKQVLTQEDIRFARTVARVQEVFVSELIKIGMIHLYLKGYRGKDLVDFKIKMTNPSTVSELQKNELWRARMELVQSAGEGVFDTTFIYKNFLFLSNDTIDAIRKGQIQDKIFQSKLLAIENSQGMNMGGMGGGMMGGMGMGSSPFGGSSFGGGGMGLGGGLAPGLGGMGESFNPEMKDLERDSSGDTRKREKRGLGETGLSREEDWVDDDPSSIKDIKRTAIPKAESRDFIKEARNCIEEYQKLRKEIEGKVEKDILENVVYKTHPFLRPMEVSAQSISEMNEDILRETFGEEAGSSENNTKKVLQEAVLKNKDSEEKDVWESKLSKMEDSVNEILEEIDRSPKKILQEAKDENK
jgi:hypothetical protein